MSKVSINSVMASEFPEATLLSSGFQGSVYAHSEKTVLKAVPMSCVNWETFSDGELPAEMLSIQWANSVNNLVVQFKDHILVEKVGHIIALERLFPCLPTAFSRDEIATAIEVAEAQLEELWATGWGHCDLKRPTMLVTDPLDVYNNIMLTECNGKCIIRLVDLGCSMLEQYDDNDIIDRCIVKDRQDWEEFKRWILNYSRE